MRIEFENKFSDLLLFNAIHQFMSPQLQGLYLLFAAFIFWSESSAQNLANAITALIWYLGLWAFQFFFNAIYLFSRKNGSVLTKHTLELQEESLLEETKFNKSYFYWHGVVKAVSRPGFIAIYVSALQAHIVPNRAFSSKSERASFLALVKEKIGTATAPV